MSPRVVGVRQRGFTLIEMVAAFFIFALAFSVLIGTASDGLRKVRLARESTQAALFAQAKLDELGVAEKLEEGGDQGQFDPSFRYELAVRKIDPPLAPNGVQDTIPVELYQIDLTVRWGERGKERSARFSTLRAIGAAPAGVGKK
jgi:general secretion pathway protein I